jgi:hypothetical protein
VILQYALLFQLTLSAFGEGFTFVTMILTGCEVDTFVDNALFQSPSPPDFWGRRWNCLTIVPNLDIYIDIFD